jgi:hypothetical protein
MVIDAMVTPSEPKSALSYPEHDKLGPLGAKTSAIQDAAALRGALIRAFEAAAQEARDAVAAIDKGSASAAVHASRKALRRARAVLGLVGDALPGSERRAVKTALQEARRALSTVRDHAVAPETLGQMALDEEDRATAGRVLANAADSMPAARRERRAGRRPGRGAAGRAAARPRVGHRVGRRPHDLRRGPPGEPGGQALAVVVPHLAPAQQGAALPARADRAARRSAVDRAA